MKIINISRDDWANYAYDNCQALRAIGADCFCFKLKPHLFKYGHEAKVVGMGAMNVLMRQADIIQIFHSDVELYGLARKIRGKNVIVYHTGTFYRQNHEMLNIQFAGADRIVYAMPEFSRLVPPGSIYATVAINTGEMDFGYEESGKTVFRHHPSNADVKGTKDIIRMMNELNLNGTHEFHHTDNTGRLSYDANLIRMSQCDVYIELFNLKQDGHDYGNFGTSAIEAAAMGKIVVTQVRDESVYRKWYGDHALMIANSEEQFKIIIHSLAYMTRSQLRVLKDYSKDWATRKHSYKAAGDHLLKHVIHA